MAFHVVGGGLAGLSASVALACAPGTREIVLHEAAPRAGGRCRSWHDAGLGVEIDNGTHAVLGANDAALAYLARIGASGRVAWLDAGLDFLDLRDGACWRIDGPVDLLRLWRRGGSAATAEIALLARLLAPRRDAAVPAGLAGATGLGRLAWDPLVRSIMNAAPGQAAAAPFAAALRRVLRGGRAGMRVGIARRSLAHCLVDPALDLLARRGASLRFGARLRSVGISGGVARALRFDDAEVELAAGDQALLALPPWELARCAPGLAPDCATSPIVNLHAVLDDGADDARDIAFRGLVGGRVEWVLRRGRVASATTSAASDIAGLPRDELRALLWPEVARALDLPAGAKPLRWRAVVERRATPLQDASFEARRPGIATAAGNLLLAGDWVVPGLPCTIEAAIASGVRAGEEALRRSGKARE
ncbi:MAG: phytoene dehydrogenase [Alphaproteobacteria bacterium]|nr:phytoene dehydrogenase [Alphaproteobacteria bacterium]